MTTIAGTSRIPGHWYPWIIAGGLGIVILVNTVLFFYAVSTFPGTLMETDDGAEALSIANLEAAESRSQLGWNSAVTFQPASDNANGRSGKLVVDFKMKSGAPLIGVVVNANFIRPTHSGYDFSAPLLNRQGGRYEADVTFPLPGIWNVKLDAVADAGSYTKTWRIEVR